MIINTATFEKIQNTVSAVLDDLNETIATQNIHIRSPQIINPGSKKRNKTNKKAFKFLLFNAKFPLNFEYFCTQFNCIKSYKTCQVQKYLNIV